jgi:hypothetical protein
MRSVLFACAAMWLLMSAPRVDASALAASSVPTISAPSAVFAVQVPDKKIEVTVDQQRSGGGMWYRSPVWVAIGVLAFVVLVMLIVLLTRSGGGGGTTIVRD